MTEKQSKLVVLIVMLLIFAAGIIFGSLYMKHAINAKLARERQNNLSSSSPLSQPSSPQSTPLSGPSASSPNLYLPRPVTFPSSTQTTEQPSQQAPAAPTPVAPTPALTTQAPQPKPPALASEVHPFFRTSIENVQLAGSDGLETQYLVQVTFTNNEEGTEILSPANTRLVDQNGRAYSAHEAIPPFPDAGIAPETSFSTKLDFFIPAETLPRKLLVVRSSGGLLTSIPIGLPQPQTSP